MFFFKQKTAYDLLMSDWSSDVCSSDLIVGARIVNGELLARSLAALCGQWDLPRAVQVIGGKAVSVGEHFVKRTLRHDLPAVDARAGAHVHDVIGGAIGRASCRERVCQYV